MMLQISEPTSEQCSQCLPVGENETHIAFAIWYPQMGGYVGRAVVVLEKNKDTCVDVYVWHDGEFPFSEGTPREIHHCMPSQFIEFGRQLEHLIKETNNDNGNT